MRYRFTAMILTIYATIACGDSNGLLNYKTSKIDTTDLFFSGEFYSDKTIAYFKDCATSKLMHFVATDIDQIEHSYTTSTKGSPVYCTFRGEYNANTSTVASNDFIGFNITESCMPIKLNKTYAAKTDTLTLTDDYKFSLKSNTTTKIEGKWGRVYKDSGVLILDNGEGIFFTINIGLRSDNNNLFLSLKGRDGEGVVFSPIEYNIN